MYKGRHLAGRHVKTAFDVAKPEVIARIFAEARAHGWIIAALMGEMKDLEVFG